MSRDDTDPLCEKACAYGVCHKSMGDPYGCGGCCACLGGCQVAYEEAEWARQTEELLDALADYTRAGHYGCVWDPGPCNLDALPPSAARAASTADLTAFAHGWTS